MKLIYNIAAAAFVTTLISCNLNSKKSDAFGNFEAIEILVSSEANGKILQFEIEEGDNLSSNKQIGIIDTTQLHLQKIQLLESIKAIKAKFPNISSQINVLKERAAKAEFERKRLLKLVEAEAATTKELDNINLDISIIEREIKATKSSLRIQKRGLSAEIPPIISQIKIIDDLISKSIITSPINGTVLTKFSHSGELATQGKYLFKVANIDALICRAYISEPQLSEVKLGQTVTVLIDSPNGEYKKYSGVITWISSKAEFTPKIIQTKEERTNLVYAIKIKVENNGFLKIGMPAEIKF